MFARNALKEKLLRNEAVLGAFQKYSDPTAVEILGLSGLDFIIIDNEHCQSNPETLLANVRTAQAVGLHPIVRARCNEQTAILKILDMGAAGVQVPNIDSVEDARKLVSAAKFPPLGTRGYGYTTRAGAYGTLSVKEFIRRGNEESLVSAHCESRASVENLEDILKVEGIDIIFIGPGDLSQSYGCAGDPQTPELAAAIRRIIEVTLAAGKIVGIACPAPQISSYYKQGVRFFAVGTDHGYTLSGAKNARDAFKAAVGE